ncbi:MAG: alanine racemase [Candidatus Bathyarchaeota archaeon]|nr:alanine racemase [Candidatus Bathyarchaeota archaeon]
MSERFFAGQPSPDEIIEKTLGYTSWLEINLDHIGYNLQNIRERVGVEVMPVVKNNAYGHGLIPIVAYLESQGVNWVMVAKLKEAEMIKEQGFKCNVLNMDVLFTDAQYKNVVEKNITQTVYTLEAAEKLSETSTKQEKETKVFVKVDTGLNRIGVKYTSAADLIEKISKLPHLNVIGIFSTFQQRPEEDKTALKRLLDVDEELKARGIKVQFRSMSSSDSVFHNPAGWLEMVRPGMSLYGVYPEPNDAESGLELRQSLQLKARIEYTKWVEEGESVTYWGRFVAPKRMRIGTLHLGFYDAIPREMANKGKILVDGEIKPSLGSVSLNHYLMDITGVTAEKGTEVTVIAESGENNLYETANTAGWMTYSLLNHLNPMMPRVYLLNGEPVALLELV